MTRKLFHLVLFLVVIDLLIVVGAPVDCADLDIRKPPRFGKRDQLDAFFKPCIRAQRVYASKDDDDDDGNLNNKPKPQMLPRDIDVLISKLDPSKISQGPLVTRLLSSILDNLARPPRRTPASMLIDNLIKG